MFKYQTPKHFHHRILMSRQSITVTYHPNSLEGFDSRGHILTILGAGRMTTPGHPAGNQQYSSQSKFFRAASIQKTFPVYHKVGESVTYMGEYAFNSFQKKQSFEGFTYFSITLYRTTTVEDIASISP